LLYRGIPVPFVETGKPIGAALTPATYFNILLIVTNVFCFAYILHKAGFKLGLLLEKRNDWLDVLAFFVVSVSCIAMWYFPFFFLLLVITGIYLVVGQLS